MTAAELLVLLADKDVRLKVQHLLGLPSDSVAQSLDRLASAQIETDRSVKELASEVKALAAAQARTDATVQELGLEVKALAAAQARTDATVKELAAAQARTDATVQELAAAQARTDATVKELSLEVKALAAAQARTDATVQELGLEVKALAAAQARTDATVQELAADMKDLARAVKETRQAVASLADNVGFGLEELASIVLPDVLRQRRQVLVNAFERRFVSTSSGDEEVDLYAEGDRGGETVIVLGEVKSRIYRAEVERFARKLSRLEPALDKPTVALMFGFVIHPSALPAATETGILVVASRPSNPMT